MRLYVCTGVDGVCAGMERVYQVRLCKGLFTGVGIGLSGGRGAVSGILLFAGLSLLGCVRLPHEFLPSCQQDIHCFQHAPFVKVPDAVVRLQRVGR